MTGRRCALVLGALTLLFSAGCTHRAPSENNQCQALEEQTFGAQGLLALTGLQPQQLFLAQAPLDRFLRRYFSVFKEHEAPLDLKRWAWLAFENGSMLLEDLQSTTPEWFAKMDEEATWDDAYAIDRPGVSLVTTSLRAMPTERPLISGVSDSGKGLAFDQLQNSLVNANEPLWLSHNSRSGRWVFVFTSYASGWILNRDAATIAKGQDTAWQTLSPIGCVAEGYAIRDARGRFLFNSRVGMVLPMVEAHADGFDVLLATSSSAEGEARFEVLTIPTWVAVPIPSVPTVESVSGVASTLLGLPYGWGGLYENRDCSAAIRDLFMPFGLWLPRNSKEQATLGEKIGLVGLSDAEKADLIVERGAPFATLLYKRGHVALYIGHRDGVPLALHSVWDLMVRKGNRLQRRHIGRIVISPLWPFNDGDVCDGGSNLLHDLESMTLLTRTSHQ